MRSSTILPILHELNDASRFRVILGSGSPRRRELMQMIGFSNLEIKISDFEENLDKSMYSISDYCRVTCDKKAESVALSISQSPSDQTRQPIIITADTIVEINDEILEKPKDHDDAVRMLSLLSGNIHVVHTAVSIWTIPISSNIPQSCCSFVEQTRVKFSSLSLEDIEAYISTGEPFDKSGGYGIQSIGGQLVEGIEGCYYNVMGLPINKLSKTLCQLKSDGIF